MGVAAVSDQRWLDIGGMRTRGGEQNSLVADGTGAR